MSELSALHIAELVSLLKNRFLTNMTRHENIKWDDVEAKLLNMKNKIWSLYEMERTGGEPDVVGFDGNSNEYLFYDCAPESPKGRRSICYDLEALTLRKENKPHHSAIAMAEEMGIEILSQAEYRNLQSLGKFDQKTSSWLQTPYEIRKLGGAIFADYRYGQVFIYHNGADSYYGARAFRGSLRV